MHMQKQRHQLFLTTVHTGAAEHVEGEGEAVESIAAEGNHSGAIYNLSGQKVEKAEKGIYIVGNKKIAY